MTETTLMTAMTERMRWLGARQGAVAQNIASADLPGYRARDIHAPDFSRMVGSAPEVKVSARMRALGSTSAKTADPRGTGEIKPNGNDVSLETELLTMAEIQMDYAAMTNLYRKQMGMFKIALGRGAR
ncbi:MAG: flagellar biosynthesis protein FlgB [Pacificimonas sp.]